MFPKEKTKDFGSPADVESVRRLVRALKEAARLAALLNDLPDEELPVSCMEGEDEEDCRAWMRDMLTVARFQADTQASAISSAAPYLWG
jgi:hypothetical protein